MAAETQLLAELTSLAAEIAASVGAELGVRRRAGFDIESKSSATDLVTDLDVWAEETIVDRLLAARPDDSILGEEGANTEGSSEVRWLIDPIDGTTDFVYAHPGFSVSIGAEVNGVAAVGVIVDPTLDQLVVAATGQGATCNGAPISVSAKDELATALVATGFSYQPDTRRHQGEVLTALLPRLRDIRRMGGAATDFVSVATGRVDAYYERGLNPWDAAAGKVIAREAGAIVTDLDGEETDGRFVIAAGPKLYPLLRDALLDAGATSQ